jgi:archaeoflavoprotein AfpA
MAKRQVKAKKKKVAWGITGAGDKIVDYVEVMKELQKEYADKVEIQVFLSKAAVLVMKYYKLEDDLKQNFARVKVEVDSNTPFLAGWMQMRKYEFMLIAPATSNTVAKIANGIGDTLLTNATSMSLKAFAPVYIAPTDYEEGIVYTKLPNGKEMKLRVRKEEVAQVRNIERMEGLHVLQGPEKIMDLFEKWFG